MADFIQEFVISVVTLFGSLVVALLAVYYDRKIESRRELDSLLDGLVFELGGNLSIAKTIKNHQKMP